MTRRNIRAVRIDGDVGFVILTRGYEAIIDAADAEFVGKWNWASAMRKNKVYAIRTLLKDEGRPGGILLHRAIANPPAGLEGDHINGDSLDNRRENLRLASHTENVRNKKRGRNNTSGYKGVYWDSFTNKWMAAITHNYKFINLGRFDDPEVAHAAYLSAAQSLFGDFARAE